MTENTNQTPGATAGYGPEGRELERESLAYGEPARTPGDVETAAAGDASEMLGEVLQSQELNPDEPAVTNEPPRYAAESGRDPSSRLPGDLRGAPTSSSGTAGSYCGRGTRHRPHRLASRSGSRHCGRRPEDAQDD